MSNKYEKQKTCPILFNKHKESYSSNESNNKISTNSGDNCVYVKLKKDFNFGNECEISKSSNKVSKLDASVNNLGYIKNNDKEESHPDKDIFSLNEKVDKIISVRKMVTPKASNKDINQYHSGSTSDVVIKLKRRPSSFCLNTLKVGSFDHNFSSQNNNVHVFSYMNINDNINFLEKSKSKSPIKNRKKSEIESLGNNHTYTATQTERIKAKAKTDIPNSKTKLHIEKRLKDFPDSVIEVTNYKDFSNFELSQIFFEIFLAAPAESIVILPPTFLSLPHILLNHSLTIKGSPGTVIEINNGALVIDSDPEDTVTISDCSFVFNIEVNFFKEKLNSDMILKECFNIDNSFSLCKILKDSHVEISGCDFRTVIHNNEVVLEEEEHLKFIKETLFEVCPLSNFIITSTTCNNFYSVIKAREVGQIKIEKCQFSDTISDCVVITDAISLVEICDSSISNCQNGIKIFNQETSICKNNKTNIYINDNEITQNRAHGVHISSKFNLESLHAERNKFNSNKSTGFVIEKIKFKKEINFSNNEFSYNSNFGVLLHEISGTNSVEDEHALIFSSNTIYDNKYNFGIKFSKFKSLSLNVDGCKVFNNLSGVLFSEMEQKSSIALTNCSFNENADMGVCFHNNSNKSDSYAELTNSILHCNSLYGRHMNNAKEDQPHMMHATRVSLKQCEIKGNKHSGVYMKNCFVVVERCNLVSNGKWAIEVPCEKDKALLKLINYNFDVNAPKITDPIGGCWGVVNQGNKCLSKACCSIL